MKKVTDERKDQRRDGRINGGTDESTEGRTDQRTEVSTMDGRTDGRADGSTDGSSVTSALPIFASYVTRFIIRLTTEVVGHWAPTTRNLIDLSIIHNNWDRWSARARRKTASTKLPSPPLFASFWTNQILPRVLPMSNENITDVTFGPVKLPFSFYVLAIADLAIAVNTALKRLPDKACLMKIPQGTRVSGWEYIFEGKKQMNR